MQSLFKTSLASLSALCLSLAATPAIADVKAGVDAWSKGDYQTAVKEWRDPALKGDPDAQFNLGQAYKLGRGVKQDLAIAGDWYRRAATQGHLQAADSYGHLLHYQGKVSESLPYLQASSERGEPRAQYLLATELFNGTNVGKDWVRAYALMTRASAAGLAPASRSLAEMDKYIPLNDRQQGIVMAGELERRSGQVRAQQVAGFPINTKPAAPVATQVDVPASEPTTQTFPGGQTYPGGVPAAEDYPPQPAPVRPAPVKVASRPAPVKPAPVKVAAAPAPAASGAWRIQLGAFGNESNATKLWSSLESRVGGLASLTPYLKNAGNVIRLQAGPFASRAAADAMCAKVKASAPGQGCISISN
jgi:uncharacterized protein